MSTKGLTPVENNNNNKKTHKVKPFLFLVLCLLKVFWRERKRTLA